MKKIFILIATFFIGFFSSAFAGEIKFVQVADPHVTAGNKYSLNVLKAAIEDINKLDNISFVVFTGDNIDSSKPENHEAFLKIIKRRFYQILWGKQVKQHERRIENPAGKPECGSACLWD